MNIKARLHLTLATALFAAANLTTHAQTWETILELDSAMTDVLIAGGSSTRALMIDPASAAADFPSLIVSGHASDANWNLHRLAQPEGSNPGALIPLNTLPRSVFSMAADAGGILYLAGDNSIHVAHSSTAAWVVQRSSDGGATWSTIRTFSLGGATAQVRGITVDSAGKLIVCGVAFDSGGYSHWIVETSADRGEAWDTVDVFKSSKVSNLFSGEAMCQALGVAELPGLNGGLFVVGRVPSGRKQTAQVWTVTRSRDGGVTWQTVDTWLPSNGNSRARKVAVDGLGRVFVMGDSGGGNENDSSPWVVRMSADGGDTWNTIFGPWQYGPQPNPLDMTIDANNNVWVSGDVLEIRPSTPKRPNNNFYYLTAMVVRIQNSPTFPWSFNSYPVSPDCLSGAAAGSITADSLGKVYVNGMYRETPTSPQKWFVKRWVPLTK
jgi:hypothetical protein